MEAYVKNDTNSKDNKPSYSVFKVISVKNNDCCHCCRQQKKKIQAKEFSFCCTEKISWFQRLLTMNKKAFVHIIQFIFFLVQIYIDIFHSFFFEVKSRATVDWSLSITASLSTDTNWPTNFLSMGWPSRSLDLASYCKLSNWYDCVLNL